MSFTLEELAAAVFRQKQLAAILFGGTFGIFAFLCFIEPNTYDAQMKILVKQNRVDPVVTPDSQAPYRIIANVSEQDLSSEAELIKSRDVLEGAATACALSKPRRDAWTWLPVVSAFAATPASRPSDDLVSISQAARSLDEAIRVSPTKGANLITVTYPSTNPTRAACVLRAVAKLYMEKHLAVHRAGGAFEFFRQEADRYKGDLDKIETQLADFGQQEQLITDGTEKELTVRRLGDFKASLLDTKAEITATQARIRSLQTLSRSAEPRQTRTIRTAPNAALKDLQTQLVTLEMKRTDMRAKFNPAYRPLQDLENQIRELKNTIADVQRVPLVEETTDTNPASDWLKVELAKARSELASLQASAPVKERAVDEYRSLALDIDQKNLKRADLVRLQKATEEKYLLYLRKQEEARIDQELDRQRILNVAIAQEPIAPVLPEPSLLRVKLGFAGLLALMLGLGGALGADFYDRTFRNSADVTTFLQVPVIGSIPLIGTDDTSRNEGSAS